MSRLLDDLLNISRIIHGKIMLKKQIIDLSSSINAAVGATRSFINAQKHTFKVSFPSSPIYINADPVRIEQLITNLLTNAAKYTKPGGHINLDVAKKDEMVEIRVKDTGIGIKPRDTKNIFEMFAQSAKPFADTHGDFGIGLKVAKDIAALHDGTIDVESEGLGKGSVFIVRLPITKKIPKKPAEELNKIPVIGRKILVVDDNKDIADSLRIILLRLGHTIETANDGTSALASVDTFIPEMVLLDIGLPDMTGYDVARGLRKKFGKNIKLVALTGYGQEKDKQLAHEAGFDFHLTKPVSIKTINEIIKECFRDTK